MLRSHRIVVVCIVKVLWIRQITFNNISDAGIRRDAIEREFADRKRFALGGGIHTVGIEVGDITTFLGVVISIHMFIVGRRVRAAITPSFNVAGSKTQSPASTFRSDKVTLTGISPASKLVFLRLPPHKFDEPCP